MEKLALPVLAYSLTHLLFTHLLAMVDPVRNFTFRDKGKSIIFSNSKWICEIFLNLKLLTGWTWGESPRTKFSKKIFTWLGR